MGGALLLVAVALGAAVAPSAAALNVVNVTTTADGGAGSLRAAFTTANTDADDTEIVLQAGATYQLTTCPGTGEDANADGDLDHTGTEPLTITGNGATVEQTCADERVIDDLSSGAFTVTDLTVTGGDTPDDGGGIRTDEPFTMSGSIVTGNHADGDGGGVQSNGGATVSDSLVDFNTAGGEGGGLDLSGGGTSSTVTRTVISENEAGDEGGGMVASGGSATLVLTDSFISGNLGDEEGGGVSASGGGVTATVSGSTFANNAVTTGVGGGLASFGGGSTIEITNSTFTGNLADHGGGLATGGAGTQTLRHLTFLEDAARISGSELTDKFGTNNTGFSAITMFGTLLQEFDTAVCELTSPVTSEGYNIDSDDSCGLGAGPGDFTGFDGELFEPLADNGGPTPTLLPAFDSTYVDAIPVADCDATVTVDQRGVARPDGPGCDIGAVEGQGAEPPPEPPVEPPTVGPIAGNPSFTG